MQSRLDAALAYAQRGWAVLPLNGKLPAIAKADGGRGVHDATTDKDKITEWWTRKPHANIGLACGAASGFWVLDIDPRHGGDETLSELEKKHGLLPATVEQFTGGGGRHVLFKTNGRAIRNGVNKLGAGLDIRSDGGYVVVDPSCHPETKQPYCWSVDLHPDEIDIAPAPDWLVELVADPPTTRDASAHENDPYAEYIQRATVDRGAYAAAALAGEVDNVKGAAIGEQEHVLNAAALKIGQIVGAGGLDFNIALDTLTRAGQVMANDPNREPWTAATIKAKVERALRDGMKQPRETSSPAGTHPQPDDARPHRLKPLPWSELADLPKREPLIKGLLDRGAFSETYGPTNSGKTFLALDIGLHVALGWEWFGHKVHQGPVIYIACEGGIGIAERLTAFRYHHGVEPAAPFYVVPASIDLCKGKADAAALVSEIAPLDPALIIIDTLARAMAGGNENAPDDMGAFIGHCDTIRQQTGAHLLVVHHTGKDETRGSRGHSSLAAAVDTMIEVSKDEVSGLITATTKKQRERGTGDAITFKLEPVDIDTDEDGDQITSCVVIPTEGEATTKKRPRITGQAGQALRLLRKAVDEGGEPAPTSNHIVTKNQIVTLSLWRRYCYAGTVTDSDSEAAKRQAFHRCVTRLQEAQAIDIWDDYVWISD